MAFPIITPEQAADYVKNGFNVAFSGFTAAGTPKVVAPAIAAKAKKEHEAGREFKINMFTGASTNDFTDGELARADAVNFRTPYQSCKDTRASINSHRINYLDMHLSQLSQNMRYGFFGNLDVVIIEAADVTDKGEILLGPGVGNVPTFAHLADKIIIELNEHIPTAIAGLHDIYVPADPPCRREIPIYKPSDRIGDSLLKVDPAKIVGIVKTNGTDGVHGEKSVILVLLSGLELTDAEMLAIRWHMGAWGVNLNSYEEVRNFDTAKSLYPLVPIIQAADSLAAAILERKADDWDD